MFAAGKCRGVANSENHSLCRILSVFHLWKLKIRHMTTQQNNYIFLTFNTRSSFKVIVFL